MADTFVKIASVTVGSGGASSMDFTSIPSTYTDLVLKTSSRTSGSGNVFLTIAFNGSSSNFSYRQVFGNGSSAASNSGSIGYGVLIDGSSDTASTFSNGEVYIPNYSGSTNKSLSTDAIQENNGTLAYMALVATLWSSTSAINQITLTPSSGTLQQYSTATLYGILKA
jgi:hypothetical protein